VQRMPHDCWSSRALRTCRLLSGCAWGRVRRVRLSDMQQVTREGHLGMEGANGAGDAWRSCAQPTARRGQEERWARTVEAADGARDAAQATGGEIE
jgi:hypothetical protein